MARDIGTRTRNRSCSRGHDKRAAFSRQNSLRSANVRAVTEVCVFCLHQYDLAQVARCYPDLGRRLETEALVPQQTRRLRDMWRGAAASASASVSAAAHKSKTKPQRRRFSLVSLVSSGTATAATATAMAAMGTSTSAGRGMDAEDAGAVAIDIRDIDHRRTRSAPAASVVPSPEPEPASALSAERAQRAEAEAEAEAEAADMPALPEAEAEAGTETPSMTTEATELMVGIRAAHEGLAAKLGRFEQLMMQHNNRKTNRAAEKPAVAA